MNFEMESLIALFEYATEGIIISNQSGTIVKANPSAERLFGYLPGELIGKQIEILVPQNLTSKHSKHREGFNSNPHPRAMGKDLPLRAKRKDDSEFPVEISLTFFKREEEKFIIAFIIDITERNSIAEKTRKLNADLEKKVTERTRVLQEALNELEHSKEQLSDALAKEKELNDMKSRFVTMASHEFRTPLSTILSSVSLISKYIKSEEDDKRQKHVQRVKSAVTNMTLILNDFLSAGRLEEGKIMVNPSEFDINELTNEVYAEMQNLLKFGQQINIQNSITTLLVSDRQMIRNILLNLISNAIKFSFENSIVSVECFHSEKNKNRFVIQVSDLGIGIPMEEQAKLFERFFRAKNAINIQGTGLGLSIVGKYVELLKGTIHFQSEPGNGTQFTIELPMNIESEH